MTNEGETACVEFHQTARRGGVVDAQKAEPRWEIALFVGAEPSSTSVLPGRSITKKKSCPKIFEFFFSK